jgi:hypothetical protein
MTNTNYTYIGTYGSFEMEYEPKNYIGSLDWFNIAQCARKRMTENCHDINRWRGERRSFYSSITKMNVNTKELLD